MLRDYQQKAVDEIRSHFSKGIKKVLLHLATGGGKTVVFTHILKGVISKNKKGIMIVRGRELVDQASQRLIRENTPHGVLMAGHWLYKPMEKIQVCSIDTLRSRKLKPEADLIVIDEAHLATSKSYVDFLSHYPDAFILAVTATPYGKSLKHIADVVVKPISVNALIEQGYLVDARVFAPSNPDTSKVSVSRATGDFKENELNQLMDKSVLIGEIVDHWINLSQQRPTLCFAVTVAHSKHIVAMFNKAGIPAVHCDADTPEEERRDHVRSLQNGDIKIISNVGIFCVGVDLPWLGCIIMARPTKSYNLFIQQAGRGTRPFSGKSDFILLDHAGNTIRHGFITDERDANISDSEGLLEKAPRGPLVCASCFAVFKSGPCPSCGSNQTAYNTGKRSIEQVDGQLREVKTLTLDQEIKRFIKQHKEIAKMKGYERPRGWVYYRLLEKYGVEVAQKYMPKRVLPSWLVKKYGSK